MVVTPNVAPILAVVCEMIAGLNGLGNWVLLAARMFSSADLFAGVILLGAIGFLGTLALNIVERRLLAWQAPLGA
jgi:sulfonate transport system permease protein